MLARFWRILTQAARVIFACRVSVLSALGGLFLFGLVLQAQNLFADLSFGDWAGGVLYWSGFFFAVFLIWAFPIHFGARKILSEDGWLVAPDLRRALSADELRSLQDRLRQEMAGLIVWLPRLLGVLPFVAIGLGLTFADRALDGARALPVAAQAHRQILWLGVADFVFGVLFIAFVTWRRPLIARMTRRFDRPEGATRRHRASQDARLSTVGRTQTLLDDFTVFSLGATALAFLIAYFWPHQLATMIPRALLAPFMFGSLVLALSWLVRVGYRLGFPALTPILIACVAITASNSHFNDLRLLPVKSPAALDQRQIEVAEAVRRWRLANGCVQIECPVALIVAAEGGASRAAFMEATLIGEIIDRTQAPGAAPGRKIFAISGVSGGAFGGATIRAALADAEAGGAPPCKFAPRSWFGAGKADVGKVRASWRSCLQALVSGDYLSDGFIGLAFRDNLAPRQWFFGSKSWFDDRAALLEQSWERHYAYVAGDQEALLQAGPACDEQSNQELNKGMCRRFGYAKDVAEGGWLPLLLLNGTSVETGRRIIASDVVSTVEVEPGAWRRTLYPAAYDLFELLSTPCAENAAPCPRAPAFPGDQPRTRDAPDLRLSTAALISARFPVISPAGVLRTPGGQGHVDQGHVDQGHGDRVVDGGYFENAGLSTALDLAAELKNLNVTPAILWVQNEPSQAGSTASTPPRPAATPFVGALDESFLTRAFGVLASPADALFATREGHGAEAAALAVQELTKFNGWKKLGYYTIGVHETSQIGPAVGGDPSFEEDCGALVAQLKGKPLAMTEVSMSWWLSATVQADLDAQICDAGNRSGLNDLIGLLTKGK